MKDPQEYKARNKIYVREYKEKLKITLTAKEKEEKRIKAREYNSRSRQKKREEQADNAASNARQKSSFPTPQVK